MKIIQHEQDLFILTGRMVDRFEIDGGMWDEITSYGRYTEKCNFNQVGSG